MQKNNFVYVKMQINTGATGGFCEGLKRVPDKTSWIWIMDDDAIPDINCLKYLCEAESITKNERASFFASAVFGKTGDPMNFTSIDYSPSKSSKMPDWHRYISESLLKINCATFVSILVRYDAFKKCGLPCRDYFIWGDDTEYTTRLTKYYGPAFLVGKSRVCHKREVARLSIEEQTDEKRLANFFYMYRNNLINVIFYSGIKTGLKVSIKLFIYAMKLLFAGKFKCSKIIISGIFGGWLSYKKFKRYIKEQIKI